MQTASPKRRAVPIYLSLLANAIVFFYKPLFNSQYSFPWDFRGVQLPMVTFLAEQLRAGRFPLWNPLSYCGYPVFANIEACFFHPLVLASAFIAAHTSLDSLPMLLEWVVVLQIWTAGIAAYYLFQEFGAGRAPAWAGALIFETGGYFASRAEHIGAIMAVAWMPLAWLAVFKLRQRFRRRWLAVLAAALGMSVLGGFPQPTLAVFVSTAALSVILVLVRLSRVRLIAWTAAGCVLGIALAAIQFIPTAQLEQHSVAKYRAGWLGTGGGLYWQSLVSLVLPNHYSVFDMSRFHGPGDITFLYLYSSLAGLALALVALALGRTRYVAALGIMLLFGMLWMLGDKTPLWRAVYPLLPERVRIGIHPEYCYCIFTLSLAGLAAVGLEFFRIGERWRYAVGIVIAVDLFLVGSGRPMNLASLKAEPGVTARAFDGSVELLGEVRKYANQAYPPWRIDTVDASHMWSVAAPITHVPSASGVSPLALENIIQLRLYLHDGYRWGWYYPVEKIESPILDLMNVKYVVSSDKAAERLRLVPKYRDVEALPYGQQLFENTAAMPRFFLVHQVRTAGSLADVDLRQTAITERPVTLPAAAPTGADQVTVLHYEPDALALSIQSAGPSLLVASENYYPGWRAWLDGKPTEIYLTDISFRGVVLPAGSHTLRMEFHPTVLPISIAISLAAAMLLVGQPVFRLRPF
ncbi:MAG: YfhO family protein [Bryobacteraceae bacterium]